MFVLFDTEAQGYVVRPFSGKLCPNPTGVKKRWKTLRGAQNEASLMNTSRRVPAGCEGHRHYSHRPLVEVHELDDAGQVVATHEALPIYFRVVGSEVATI